MTDRAMGSHLRLMSGPSEQESVAKAKREADRAKALRANLRRRKAALNKPASAMTEPSEDGGSD